MDAGGKGGQSFLRGGGGADLELRRKGGCGESGASAANAGMGKQVQFYMTHEDEKNFLASISDLAPVRLLYRGFADPSHMVVESFEPVGAREGNAGVCPGSQLCLVNATLGAPPKVNFYPEQSRHCLDRHESEVVDFDRCELAKGRYKPSQTWLNDGRLWFDEQHTLVKKSDAFIKWANSLLKWVRRNYERDARGIYVAPNALELSKAGKLQLGPSAEPELSLQERKRILGLL